MTAPVSAPDGRAATPALELRQARRAPAPDTTAPPTRRERREAARRRRGGRFVGARVSAPRSVGGRLLVVVLAAVLLAGGLLVLSARRVGTPPPVGAAGAGAPGAPTGHAVEAAGTATVVGVEPGAQAGASPARVLQGLLDVRAAALAARDAASLTRAEATGSAAHTADTALVRRLVAARQRYVGLSFAAHDVVVQERTGDRVVLRARIARSAYELVGADGTRTPQPASGGTGWEYVLVGAGEGWRLAEVAGPG